MVYDHYKKKFPTYPPIRPYFPYVPEKEKENKKLQEEIVKYIEDFKKARDAAIVVDNLTEQPDCEDLEKKKLEERIAELEKQVKELRENCNERI
jgi:hypothetical protein